MAFSLLVTVAVSLFSACDYVRPLRDVCEQRLGPSEVHVTTEPVDYTVNHTVSTDDLTRMGAMAAGREIVGLTHTTMKSSLTLGSNGVTNSVSHKRCLRPVVNVSLSFAPTIVYISRDNPEGGCEFAVTMEHELQHVAAYRDFLATAGPEIEQSLRAYFGNRIFYFDSDTAADKGMQEQVNSRIAPFIEQSMARISETQQRLDTPEEYDRLERRCPSSGSVR
jgi:hypothetical protein